MILKPNGWGLLTSNLSRLPFLSTSFNRQTIAGSAIESAPLPGEERPARGFTVKEPLWRWSFKGKIWWNMVNIGELVLFFWIVEYCEIVEWSVLTEYNGQHITTEQTNWTTAWRLRKRFRRGLKKDASARSIPSCLGHVLKTSNWPMGMSIYTVSIYIYTYMYNTYVY